MFFLLEQPLCIFTGYESQNLQYYFQIPDLLTDNADVYLNPCFVKANLNSYKTSIHGLWYHFCFQGDQTNK